MAKKLSIILAALTCFQHVDAQKLHFGNSLLSVSGAFRCELKNRFTEFLRLKQKKEFHGFYQMLTPDFRQENLESDFIADYQKYYSDGDGFVGFDVESIGESMSESAHAPESWTIRGCLTEEINRRRRSYLIDFEAIWYFSKESPSIYFNDATTRPNPLGHLEKCVPRKDPGKNRVQTCEGATPLK